MANLSSRSESLLGSTMRDALTVLRSRHQLGNIADARFLLLISSALMSRPGLPLTIHARRAMPELRYV